MGLAYRRTSTAALPATRRAFSSRRSASVTAGFVFGISPTKVTPPRAASTVPVAMLSTSELPPGSRKCTWRSVAAGSITASPTSRRLPPVRTFPTDRIRPEALMAISTGCRRFRTHARPARTHSALGARPEGISASSSRGRHHRRDSGGCKESDCLLPPQAFSLPDLPRAMATAPPRTGWTYATSGVDVSVRARALAALLASVKYRSPPYHGRPLEAPGHYAGLIRIGRETIAITTDTVGTKVLLAERLGRWEEVGEDLVGVNVNDLAAMGARPAGLVDTILCAGPDQAVFARSDGASTAASGGRCALLGGETAMVPDMVAGFDLGGARLRVLPPGPAPVIGAKIIRGHRIPGDPLERIPCERVHASS